MKLTKREITLVFLLLIVAMLYFGLTYLVVPQFQTVTDKQAQLDTLNGQLSLSGITGATLDAQLSQAKSKSDELAKPFAQSIDPEQLDYWVNTLLKQNNVSKLSSAYSDSTPAFPDYSKETAGKTTNTQSGITLQNTVDAANGVQSASPSPSPSPSASAQPSASAPVSANAAAASLNAPQNGATVQPKTGLNCVQLVLGISGSYDAITKFLDALYANGRMITVDNISIATDTTGVKTASISIRFYGVPLLSGKAQGYSFPAPAGQNVLMNAAPAAAPTTAPTPTPLVAPASASASASAKK